MRCVTVGTVTDYIPAMAAPRKSTAKKPTRPNPTRADGRPKSKLTMVAEEAATAAKRDLLLKTCKAEG